MNLTNFLKQTDALTAQYSTEQLVAFIHDIGRVFPDIRNRAVRESMGEVGAKQRLMTSYKDAYPRRSAFREEMRHYGWIDTKRK